MRRLPSSLSLLLFPALGAGDFISGLLYFPCDRDKSGSLGDSLTACLSSSGPPPTFVSSCTSFPLRVSEPIRIIFSTKICLRGFGK